MNKSNDKFYLQMLHLILFFFHQRSNAIPYGMNFGKHICHTNMNIYKKIQNFLNLFTIYFDFTVY